MDSVPTSRMQWSKLLCSTQLDGTPTPERFRSAFEKDHDKLVFSPAFRRLARKTQVHPLVVNDHIHNRLTHSIEVACIGRTLGRVVGEFVLTTEPQVTCSAQTFGAVVQAACLAHDIGNPPFGHAGEYAIRKWMLNNAHRLENLPIIQRSDFTLFEGNAQGFRMASTSISVAGNAGLTLTCATLGSMIKYPWFSNHQNAQQLHKFNFYYGEAAQVQQLVASIGLLKQGDAYCRHPLSYLVEAADDICYRIMDIEDAFELGIIEENELLDIFAQLSNGHMPAAIDPQLRTRALLAVLRSNAMDNLVLKTAAAFAEHYQQIMSGQFTGPLLAQLPHTEQQGMQAAGRIATDKIFPSRQKSRMEKMCYESINVILGTLVDAVDDFAQNPQTSRPNDLLQRLDNYHSIAEQDQYQRYMRVIDFVSGMTDNYATQLAEELQAGKYNTSC